MELNYETGTRNTESNKCLTTRGVYFCFAFSIAYTEMDSEAPATEVPKDENQSDSQVEQLKPITPAAKPVATSTNETQTASQDSQPPAVAETDKSTATEQSQTANQTAAVAEVKEEVNAPTTVTNGMSPSSMALNHHQ